MKCAKCGYISFDYLSECKKCQTSMATVREALGFSAAKPAVPSLLGSLLRDHQPEAQQKDHAAGTETDIAFNPQEEISGALSEGSWSESADTHRAAADSGETQEDFSLLDLSDEELELLIEKDVLADGENEQTQSTGTMEGGGDNYAHGPLSSVEADSFSPEIAMPEAADASPAQEQFLSFGGFDETENETNTPHLLDLETDSGDEPERPESEAGPTLDFEHAVENPAALPADAPNDFVIDLSESDLEALLKRLEGPSKEKV